MVVVKVQIYVGGCGKGGGVKLVKNLDDFKEYVGNIIGMMLKIFQILGGMIGFGKLVCKVLVVQDVYVFDFDVCKEYYIFILMDREKKCNVIIYFIEGGMDIEEVVEKILELVYKEYIDL